MKTQPKRGRGRPKGEPTKLVRAYRDDVPRLCRDGETQAEAIRRLIATMPKKQKPFDDGSIECLIGRRVKHDIVNSETGEIILPLRRDVTKTIVRKLTDYADKLECDDAELLADIRLRLIRATGRRTDPRPNTKPR